MVSAKQASKVSQLWGRILPGARVYTAHQTGVGQRGREGGRFFTDADRYTVSPGETSRRMFRTYTRFPYWTDDPEDVWLSFYDGKNVSHVYPTDVDMIVMAPLSKAFRSQATKGSRWRFVQDWTFSGYDGTSHEHTIPAGTEFEVINNKIPDVHFGSGCISNYFVDKALMVAPNPDLEQAFPIDRWHKCHHIPAREVSAYVELAASGAQRIYWTIEDNTGKRLVDKRFKNIGNVKSSLRVRGGLVDADPINDVSRWFDQGNEWGTEHFPTENGVWAVQRDHATDAEMSREDMLEYMTIAKLSC